MELSAYALHEELRWSFAGATERVRVRGVSTRGATGYILISVGRRVAPDPRRAIGRKVS